MTRAAALRALLLATSTFVPFTAFAQSAGSPAAQSGTADAIRVLLDQATYWRGQYQDDKANEALGRVLVLDPNNADALAMQAQAAADDGERAVAATALARLKVARPDDPRIPGIEQALQKGPVDSAALAEARALAKDNKPAEAVAAYRRAFKSDTPPAALATEYYQALADTDVDWLIPRAGLAAVLRANPQDLRAQLAYAELLTYHDETRREGIERLGKLALNPTIAAQATKDLRQSLTWLPAIASSIPQYDIYLSQHPDDAGIAHLAETAKGDTAEIRVAGFEALQQDKLDDAAEKFSDALKINPNDSDSMIGLGLVRMRQNKYEDGAALIKQAIVLDPSKADQFQPLLEGGNINSTANNASNPANAEALRRAQARYYAGPGWYNSAAARRIRGQWSHLAALVKQGEFAQAEALLRRLAGRRPSGNQLVYLADIEARAGNLPAAEANYRTVLARSPRNVKALGGLAAVLAREGKLEEAETLFAEAARLPGGASVGAGHAEALRLQAEQTADPAAQIALFRAAVNADPDNPWLQLDMARALHSQNNDAEAREIMAPVGRGPRPTSDQLQAAIYFYNDIHDYAAIPPLVDRLSRKDQTPQMVAIAANAQVRDEVRQAQALGSKAAERDRLLSVAGQPDPSGLRIAVIGRELIRLGDKAGAREAVRVALASHPATAEQRVTYAGVLLGAGYPNEARRITQLVNPTNGVMTYQLSQVRDSAAVEASDKLNAAGDPAAAYDQLAPRLAASPDNTDLKLALARLYTSNQQPRKAIAITQGLLEQNPSNLSVRSSAVYATLAAGDYSQAESIAQETTTQFPEEPQAWLDLANVERARGNSGRALRDLRTAKALRDKQLAAPDTQSGSAEPDWKVRATAAIEPLRRRYAQYAQYIPANTASDVSPYAPPEPVTRQYAQYNAGAPLPIAGGPATSPLVTAGYAPFNPAPPPPPRAALASAAAASPGAAAATPAPILEAQNSQLLDAPAQGNPFQPGSSPLPTINQPSVPGSAGVDATLDLTPTDPITAQIDQGIQQLRQEVAPRLDASLYIRGRTGTDGFEKLIEVGAPLEASYSPNGEGRLKVVVTPTYLYSGSSHDSFDTGRFGTNPLGGLGPAAVAQRNQTAFGAGLDVGYAYSIVTADIGASPFGFREENMLGGIEVAPKLTDTMTLRLLVERRMVTDSLLAYAGTKDVRTGETWGGVTRNRGHIQLDGTVGLFNYFAGAGGAYYEGDKVEGNTEIDATVGTTYPVWRTATNEVRIGAEVVYFGFDKNLGGFTLGQGGYFSPQDYLAILFPVTWRDQITPDLRFTIGGAVGYQTFRSKSSPVFPNDSGLQAQLVSLASTNTALATTLAGEHGAGIAGGVNGEVDYRVNTNLHIGGRVGFDHAGNFSEGTGLVYARYVFDDTL